MDVSLSTSRTIQVLKDHSSALNLWGHAVDGTPIYSARCGGLDKPAVLITAGVHAHEVGGVHAALQLLTQLKTQKEVNILPLRDPFGFSGTNHCLSFAVDKEISIGDYNGVLDFLSTHARLIWKRNEVFCFQLGETGFIWHPQPVGLEGFTRVNAYMTAALRDFAEVFSTLFGKHVLLLDPAPFTEPNGGMARCWHAWISPEGEWLNLNRTFGEREQPGEVAALQKALEVIQPGLVIDIQEDDTKGFWFASPSAPLSQSFCTQVMARCLQTMQESQFPVYSAMQMQAEKHRDLEIDGFLIPDTRVQGFFRLNQEKLNEGHNLLSFSAHSATAMGVEAPLQLPLEKRIDGIVLFVSLFIREWEVLLSHGEVS